MSRKRVPPEAQIIALFSGLTEDDKKMVMFGLNAMMAQLPPKSTTVLAASKPVASAGKKSSRKNGQPELTQNTEEETANDFSAGAGDLHVTNAN